MAWEHRPGTSNLYYCRTVKRGGRHIRQYIGCGEEARQAAAAVEYRRHQRETERESRRVIDREWQTAAAPLVDLCSVIDLLTGAALTAAGYHRPYRGAWRRRNANRIARPGPADASA